MIYQSYQKYLVLTLQPAQPPPQHSSKFMETDKPRYLSPETGDYPGGGGGVL